MQKKKGEKRKRKFRHLTWEDRIRIETLLNIGISKPDIAKQLKVTKATIYNELKRGCTERIDRHLVKHYKYSPELAEQRHQCNIKAQGAHLKIGTDIALANHIETMICDKGYSPEAVVGELDRDGWGDYKVRICTKTVYNYIDKKIFFRLTNEMLPVKRRPMKKKKRKVRTCNKRQAGTSIEERAKAIETREEFGHWEMDSVIGKKISKNRLLVFTERKTRKEILVKLGNHTAQAVVEALDDLEHKWGQYFRDVFKTITVDNGSEFSYSNNLERSCLNPGEQRTKLYYCHPYSSWERGSNENRNKLVRRKIPKGSSFDQRTNDEIQEVEDWINEYPRGIFGFRTAGMLFKEEIERIFAERGALFRYNTS